MTAERRAERSAVTAAGTSAARRYSRLSMRPAASFAARVAALMASVSALCSATGTPLQRSTTSPLASPAFAAWSAGSTKSIETPTGSSELEQTMPMWPLCASMLTAATHDATKKR